MWLKTELPLSLACPSNRTRKFRLVLPIYFELHHGQQHMISRAYLSYLLCWCKSKSFCVDCANLNFTFLVKHRVILHFSGNNN